MRLQLLGSTVGASGSQQYAMSYLINDSIVIDAGSLGWQASLDFQKQVKHLILSHAHLDHIASLPIWLDNIFAVGQAPPRIYASQETWEALNKHILNDEIWPDLLRVAASEFPFYEPIDLKPEATCMIDGVSVTAVPLDHIVPTLGFILDDGQAAMALISDTAPTHRIWELCHDHPRLKAVFLEASFPNSLDWLARKTMHLTPAMALAELEKLDRPDVAVYFVHLKPQYRDVITSELCASTKYTNSVAASGFDYNFS